MNRESVPKREKVHRQRENGAGASSPLASILIPTHSRADTLRIAVASALGQSVRDVEVLIIGDGASENVRTVADAIARSDSRVRFFDHEKGPNHGESYRHEAILAARSDAIFYLCDDDLFMRDHVADLLELLEDHNFVQSLNGWVTGSGRIDFYPANLSDPDTIAWHLRDDVMYNAVSITGTAHSKDFYLRIGDPWTTTPEGFWPDHYQARKFFRHPDFSGATSARMTALQFPTTQDGRSELTDDQRASELRNWAALAATETGQATIDSLVRSELWLRLERDCKRISALHLDTMAVLAELGTVTNTKSWRITRPLRAIRGLWPR